VREEQKTVIRIMRSLGRRFGVRTIITSRETILYDYKTNTIKYNPKVIVETCIGLLGRFSPECAIAAFFHEYAHKKQDEMCPGLPEKRRQTGKLLSENRLPPKVIMGLLDVLWDSQLWSSFYASVLPDEYRELCLKIQRELLEKSLDFCITGLMVLEPTTIKDRIDIVENLIDATAYSMALKCEERANNTIRAFHPELIGFYEDWKELVRKAMGSKDPCVLIELSDELVNIVQKRELARYIYVGRW